MKEILLTSSVLILALLLLRVLFRSAVSRRVQYALWLLVLVRLLVPVHLPAVNFSLLTAAEPVGQAMTEQLDRQELYIPTDREPLTDHPEAPDLAPSAAIAPSDSQVWVVQDDETAVQYQKLTLADLLRYIWYGGMAVMAVWFLFVNLRFRRKLCKVRVPYRVDGCRYPVYLVAEGLPSPCLFGLFRPAIYLTPAAAATPERLRHVLVHEQTHARHGDPWWALLRCVCLTVYWFDPLVWAAAAVSKTDCELACDEGALRQLGEAERIPYGRTLLALIPVQSRPANPLLSATTMASGKRALRDRITRIAASRQTRFAALFAVAALAAVVCAVTFTGGTTASKARPLTGEELAYFNEEFFNGEDYNFRNQFLSSLYKCPEDINLYELFYCGVTDDPSGTPRSPSPEELAQVYGGALPDCARYKATTADFDDLLERYTGLTLAQTYGVGLDQFTYLPEYDAYYWAHGDTNYRMQVTFSSGERQGDTIRLYYDDTFYADGAKCLTLTARPDGGYWFVSNLRLPSRPSYAPDAVIDLTDADLYTEPALTLASSDTPLGEIVAFSPVRTESGGNPYTVAVYRTADGALYAGIGRTDREPFEAERLWTLDGADAEGSSIQIASYSNVLGHDGFTLQFSAGDDFQTWYYYFDDAGTVHLLVQAGSVVWEPDLDGDGTRELLWRTSAVNAQQQTWFLFPYGGGLRLADLNSRIRETYPNCDYLNLYCWGQDPDHITMKAFTRPVSEQTGGLSMNRNLYYENGTLSLYRVDQHTYTDHAADGIDAPAYALAAAKAETLEALDWWQTHTGVTGVVDGVEQQVGTQAEWDDWHITGLSQIALGEPYTSLGLEVYFFSYELHSSTPELVVSAGGMYVQEDGWVGGFYVENPFVVFLNDGDGEPTLLDAQIPSDVGREMTSPLFAAAVAQIAMDNGLLSPSEVDARTLLDNFCSNGFSFLNTVGTYPAAERTAVIEALASFHNQGLFDEEGDLRHTMQNVAWSQRSLTEAGAGAWRELVERTGISPGGIGGSYSDLDEAILNSILDHRQNASSHKDDFYAAAYDVLDTRRSGNTCTVYLYIAFGSYDLTEEGYVLQTGGEDPAALTFATINGLYQLTEYWTPGGGAHYETDLRTVFPAEAAETVLARTGWKDLSARLDAAAEAQYQALLEETDYRARAAQVEFTGRALDTTPDEMTYEERFAWCQDSGQQNGDGYHFSVRSAQADGTYLLYTGIWTSGPADTSAQPHLYLRFPDGALADLPLPSGTPADAPRSEDILLSGDTLTYTVTFPEPQTDGESGALLHLQGTYRYTVDLEARTVSLRLENN
ncbi:M56 family metallopeptidase [Dysosmobacter sp.]|uniref:M56 family metallopeptidase n=1 Tax=Dysosmobacter sp. TaxID=2591382 RepID=UPI002616DE38|nr:M56 family metallopeptidase [Dysosmobacter sp.]